MWLRLGSENRTSATRQSTVSFTWSSVRLSVLPAGPSMVMRSTPLLKNCVVPLLAIATQVTAAVNCWENGHLNVTVRPTMDSMTLMS